MKERVATGIGFVVAAVIPTVIIGLSTPLTTLNGTRNWSATIEMLPYWYFFTVVLALPIAIPAYVIARKYHLIGLRSALLAGCVIGIVVSVLMDLQCPSLSACLREDITNIAFLSVTGGLSGFVFWSIWKHHEDRRDDDTV